MMALNIIMLLFRSLVIFIAIQSVIAQDGPKMSPAMLPPNPMPIMGLSENLPQMPSDEYARPMPIASIDPVMQPQVMPAMYDGPISDPMPPENIPFAPSIYSAPYPGPMSPEQQNCAITSEMNTCCSAETQFIPDSIIQNCADSQAIPEYYPRPIYSETISSSGPIDASGNIQGPFPPSMGPYPGGMPSSSIGIVPGGRFMPAVEPQDTAFPILRPIDNDGDDDDSDEDSSPTTIRKSKMPSSAFSSEVPKPNFARAKGLPPSVGVGMTSSDASNLGSVQGMAVQSSGSPIYQRKIRFNGKTDSKDGKSTEYQKKGAHMSRVFIPSGSENIPFDGPTPDRYNSRGPLRNNDPCAMECAFRKNDFIDMNNTFDINKISKSFVDKASEPWKSTVKSIISKCYSNLTDFNINQLPMSGCNGSALIFMSCFTKNLYLECPTTQQLNKDPSCPKKTEQLKSCDPSKQPSPPPMMYPYGIPPSMNEPGMAPPMPMGTRIRPRHRGPQGEPMPELAVESPDFIQPQMVGASAPKGKYGHHESPISATNLSGNKKPYERKVMPESSSMSGGAFAGGIAGGIAGGVVGGMVGSKGGKSSGQGGGGGGMAGGPPGGMQGGMGANAPYPNRRRIPDSPIMTAISSPVNAEETSVDGFELPDGAQNDGDTALPPMAPNGPKSMKTKKVERKKADAKNNTATNKNQNNKKPTERNVGKKVERNDLNKKKNENGRGVAANKKQVESKKNAPHNKHSTNTAAKNAKGDKKTHADKKNEKSTNNQGKAAAHNTGARKEPVGKKTSKQEP